jgi:adenylate kinase family enzyme
MHIHLLGPSGSGTSTLGHALAEELKIPWFDSDDIFWEKTDPPFTAKRPIEQRIARLYEIDEKNESWIISGSMLEWGDSIREKIDLIIYLYIEKEERLRRLIKRERERFGDRIEAGHDMYENHKAFIEWAGSYETGGFKMRSRKSEMAWIEKASCRIIIIEKEIPLDEEIAIVLKGLANPGDQEASVPRD